MNRQRKFILLASVTGILSMFLPWVDKFFENYNGLHNQGIAVFACFLISAIISITGNRATNLDKTKWVITLITSCIAVLIMIITFFCEAAKVFSYGFYLALLSSGAVIVAAYLFRTPGQNINDGFDSLKKDIQDKTK